MPRPKAAVPSYCHHRRSDRGYVTVDGRQHTLPGPYNSDESKVAYDRLIGEYLGNGRVLADVDASAGPTITMLIADFRKWATKTYVGADGKPTR